MDVREKLISLLILTDPNPYTCESESGSCELTTCTECRARSTADLLIANGVTVQEWISVDDRLPDQSGEVLVIVSGNPQKNITLDCAYELAEYDPYDGWIMEMWPEWEDAVVTHWMPLPEPPKGE